MEQRTQIPTAWLSPFPQACVDSVHSHISDATVELDDLGIEVRPPSLAFERRRYPQSAGSSLYTGIVSEHGSL